MKAVFGIVFIILLAGCQTTSQLITYAGGDGSCCQQAVVINNATYRETGRMAERVWLEQKYPGHQETKESDLNSAGRHYDVVDVATAQGQVAKVYFDATEWFAK
jgi:hypothetical protein